MEKIAKVLSWAHRGALLYLAAFTAPALLVYFFVDPAGAAATVLERLAPAWGWLTGLWFLAGVYFCGCLALSPGFREELLTRIAGFRERDEREALVTAKAARSVYLVTLGCFIAAGLAGMVRLNVFAYTRWKGDRVPPLVKVGKYELRRGEVAKRGFFMWPSVGIPVASSRPESSEREDGNAQYYYEGGSIFGPEVSGTLFALAVVQILLFHLFARRVKA